MRDRRARRRAAGRPCARAGCSRSPPAARSRRHHLERANQFWLLSRLDVVYVVRSSRCHAHCILARLIEKRLIRAFLAIAGHPARRAGAATGARRRRRPRGALAAAAASAARSVPTSVAPLPAGASTGSSPKRRASAIRRSGCATHRSSPVRRRARRRPRAASSLAAAERDAAGRARDREGDREVGAGLLDAHAADHVDEHVGAAERDATVARSAPPAHASGCGRCRCRLAAAALASEVVTSACTSTSTAGCPPSTPARRCPARASRPRRSGPRRRAPPRGRCGSSRTPRPRW